MGTPYNPFDLPHNPLEDKKRHVIAEGTEILGGVLHTRAGIVVDIEENPDPYQATLEEIDKRLSWTEEPSVPAILQAVHFIADKRIYHCPSDYAMVLKQEAESRGLDRMTPLDHIGLSRFVNANIGICQEHSLLSGAMLRLLQERGDLASDAEVSLVSTRPNDTHPDRHTLVAFNTAEENFTIDVVSGLSSNIRNAFALARA